MAKKTITMNDLLLFSNKTLTSQLMEMYNLVCSSEPLDEDYLFKLKEMTENVSHTLNNFMFYRNRICEEGNKNVKTN